MSAAQPRPPEDRVFGVVQVGGRALVRLASDQMLRMLIVSVDEPNSQLSLRPQDEGRALTLSEFSETGVVFADYGIEAAALRIPLSILTLDQRNCLRCDVLDGVVRIQRRGHFRLASPQIPISVRSFPKGAFEPVTAADLSGGGAAVRIHTFKGAVGSEVQVRIELPGRPVMEIPAKVQRVIPNDAGPTTLCLEFVQLRSALQDRIAAYVMQEETRRRRTSLAR